jgi:diketogulonate reductase-like aldo/keto reductase
VANFEPAHIDQLVEGDLPLPAVNQAEIHSYLTRNKLIDYCRDRRILLQAHGIFHGRPPDPDEVLPEGAFNEPRPVPIVLLNQPIVKSMAEKYGFTAYVKSSVTRPFLDPIRTRLCQKKA